MIETIPTWGLTLVYWLHILATVVWIGASVSLAVIFFPAMRQLTDSGIRSVLYREIQKRIQPVGWLSLVILSATGLIQMSVHPSYEGFLTIENSWSIAIFSKHAAIFLLFLSMAVMSWGILPELKRISLKVSLGKQVSDQAQEKLEKREKNLLNLNLILSLVVLLLTAWARAVS